MALSEHAPPNAVFACPCGNEQEAAQRCRHGGFPFAKYGGHLIFHAPTCSACGRALKARHFLRLGSSSHGTPET